MKKLMTYLTAGIVALTMNSCLDLDPTSTITDANYWKSSDQFEASHTGLMGLFREKGYTFIELGEMRSDIYGGVPFSGESSGSYSYMWDNMLSQDNPVLSDFGGMYTYINQCNLMIAKATESDVITDAQRSRFLGAAYGMRAFYYFQLLRSYGDAVIYTDYTTGSKIDLNKVSKGQSPAADVMALIKSDIKASEDAYNGNYAFPDGRTSWSLAATKMLKGEVYLWSGKQMGGGTDDYRTAKQAYLDVDNADVDLLANFTDVFAFSNKSNKEIILSLYNGEKETALWGGYYSGTLVMQKANVGSYYIDDEDGNEISFDESDYKTHDGLMYVSLNKDMCKEEGEGNDKEVVSQVYLDGDKRSHATLRTVWRKANGAYMGVIANKYHGTMLAGGSSTSWYDDQPIYRYADCLLGLCEAKALLGEDITEDINKVRERAYGKAYFESHPDVQYPNDKTVTKFVGSDADPVEAVLKERLRELMFEGKRWYDIRLMDKATKYSTASASKLLWPIDENALGENGALKQTKGYEKNTGKE